MIGKLGFMDLQILHLVQREPRIHTCRICRDLNRKWTYFCDNHKCFANIRKRAQGHVIPCVCRIPLSTLRYHLKKLVKLGLLKKRREKKPDGKNKRGWDLFQCYYSTLNVAFGGL